MKIFVGCSLSLHCGCTVFNFENNFKKPWWKENVSFRKIRRKNNNIINYFILKSLTGWTVARSAALFKCFEEKAQPQHQDYSQHLTSKYLQQLTVVVLLMNADYLGQIYIQIGMSC